MLAAEAVAAARQSGDRPVLAFALQTLGDTLDDPPEAEAASVTAGELARELAGTEIRYGPTAGDAVACGAASNLAALWAYRSVPKALHWQRRAVALAEREGDRRITAVNNARLGAVHLLAGTPQDAAESIERAERLLTGPVTARWEDIVGFARAQLLRWQGEDTAAERALRGLTTSTLAGGRVLHQLLGSCALAEVLIDRGAVEEAAAVLERSEAALQVSVDEQQAARLQVCRARLLRLSGRSTAAATVLRTAAAALDPRALAPERIVWLVEAAALAECGGPLIADAPLEALDLLSERTGVHVPPWERRQLAHLSRRSSN